jgi:NitT/TauT family transport system permease protein
MSTEPLAPHPITAPSTLHVPISHARGPDPARPNIYRVPSQDSQTLVVERPLSVRRRLYNLGWLRKLLILATLCLAWQAYGVWLGNELIFPSLSQTMAAFIDAVASGELPVRCWASLKILLVGYGIGLVLAFLLAVLAISSRIGNDLLETLTSMFNPLPAIALLPLSLLWFGLGVNSVIFVLVHSVLWAVALNTHAGFRAVSQTLRMVGQNYGLSSMSQVVKILLPAAFPSILSGLKIGWAFAWRTLIAAELVFGVSSGAGGLGWFIFQSKNQLEIPSVFAGLLTVVLIGLAVESLIFRTIERKTIQRWGMN